MSGELQDIRELDRYSTKQISETAVLKPFLQPSLRCLAFCFTVYVHPPDHLSGHPVQHLFFCLSCSHFYKPLLRRGFSKMVSQSAVFFLSAFFHEVRAETETTVSVSVDTVDSSQYTVKGHQWVISSCAVLNLLSLPVLLYTLYLHGSLYHCISVSTSSV